MNKNNIVSQLNKDLPTVSILIAMRNEEKYIGKCLEGFIKQNYPKEKFDIFIMDGCSEDNSIKIVNTYKLKFNKIHILKNERLTAPAGWNLGIKVSKNDIKAIFSAHSVPSETYIETAVKTMLSTGTDCVGGSMSAVSNSMIGKAISYATSTPLGMGASVFHYSKKPQYVNTVYQGFFRRELFEIVGNFDEDLVRNQDDEMSYRLRKNGREIYYDPNIKSVYYNRAGFTKLFKQYFQYGLYKPLVFRKLKYGMQVHHFIPAFFLIYLLLLIVFSNSIVYFFPLILYFILCIYFSIKSKSSMAIKLLSIIVYPILHISYGLGFLMGVPRVIYYNPNYKKK
jgi:GT2 family glycosyltransferase